MVVFDRVLHIRDDGRVVSASAVAVVAASAAISTMPHSINENIRKLHDPKDMIKLGGRSLALAVPSRTFPDREV
jgi:hypothetical protein